jgi:hypothetical protein
MYSGSIITCGNLKACHTKYHNNYKTDNLTLKYQKTMGIENNDLEMKEVLQNLKDSEDDIDFYINEAYDDIIFLGTSLSHKKEVIEIVTYMTKLCIIYFEEIKAYEKIIELNKLAELIKNKNTRIIDDVFIDKISIFTN